MPRRRNADEAKAAILGRRLVTQGGCWEWQGAIAPTGYGQFSFEGRQQGVHRVAYQLWRGPIPDGLWVLHRCDNRPCCNPDHLFLGDAAANNSDMDVKGRANRVGFSRRYALRIPEGDVGEIRRRYFAGEKQIPLAEAFGISQSQVSRIVRGESR